MSDYCVIGRRGFLGSALARKLGDVDSVPTPETKVLFHFGSHTHPKFEKNPHLEMKEALDSFSTYLPYCAEHGILFVYPSSALVYEGNSTFSRFKRLLEDLANCYQVATLGLRIFPVYGPGENHTVISQWCRSMMNGERPIIWGEGDQERDFVFIEDAVARILAITGTRFGVEDIGVGRPISFNTIVRIINEELGTSIQPEYVDAPSSYAQGVVCQSPFDAPTDIRAGIRKVIMAIDMESPVEESYA